MKLLSPKKPKHGKRIYRQPTPDDPRTRITRTPDEMRDIVLTFRVSLQEMNDLYRTARSRNTTMSYMIRQALSETYPEIFLEANRYIRAPRKKPKPIQSKTIIQQSYADGKLTVFPYHDPDDVVTK